MLQRDDLDGLCSGWRGWGEYVGRCASVAMSSQKSETNNSR